MIYSKEDVKVKELMIAFLLAQGADAVTTSVNLSRGCVEANPIYGSSQTRVLGTKAAVTVTWAALAHVFKDTRPKTSKAILVTGIVSGAAAATWNGFQTRKCVR